MKCPFCSHLIAEQWQTLERTTDHKGKALPKETDKNTIISTYRPPNSRTQDTRLIKVQLVWFQCPNESCSEIVVRVIRRAHLASADVASAKAQVWFGVPQHLEPTPVDALIPADFADNFREAQRILAHSPRMSAVLARRILADLLERYANLNQFSLAARIDGFIEDSRHPSNLRDNLHYLREIGDFGAHTQRDSEDRVVDATPEEAQWTLEVIRGLFDYFIVGPEKDRIRRAEFDKKLAQAGRKAIKPRESKENE